MLERGGRMTNDLPCARRRRANRRRETVPRSRTKSPTRERSHAADRDASDGLAEVDVRLLRGLWQFRGQHAATRDDNRLLRGALKLAQGVFEVAEGCVAFVPAGVDIARVLFSSGARSSWDTAALGAIFRGMPVSVPADIMFSRIRRKERMWGAIALCRPEREFDWKERKAFSLVGEMLNELLAAIDAERAHQVRAQVDRKLLEQVQPKHLFYKILHGIRSLTEYDHSAALLMYLEGDSSLEVVAEQVSVEKAKSPNVGLKLPLDSHIQRRLAEQSVFGFDRREGQWTDWTKTSAEALAELLDYNPQRPSPSFPKAENSLLCAPLITRAGLLGVLKVAAVHPGALGPYEAELVRQFLPQGAVALGNLRRTERLEQQVLAAERKNAMADLARGVAHDINNALGATVPLIEQLRSDLEDGSFDESVADDDLRQVEQSLKVCRRIFGGMLTFARSAKRNRSEVSLLQAVQCAVAVHHRALECQNVDVRVEVNHELPALTAVHADVEQLLLNLVSNARDALADGGTLAIAASRCDGGVELVVSDTGCGISSGQLAKMQEPFFTTKPTGTGLGLAICRSIVSEMRGKMSIESQPGRGTTVRVLLPLAEIEPSEAGQTGRPG
jgi:signal transduction histidine kinase